MACPQKGPSNREEDEDGQIPACTAGRGALRPGASLPVTPPELEGAGHGAGVGSQDRPQEAWDGSACVPVSPALTGGPKMGHPSTRPGLGEKAPVDASFDTLHSDLNPGF